jgi:hypothetical protein
MQDDDAVGRAAQSEAAGAAAGIPASTRPSRANAGPVILPPETLALMEDASTTVPFTVVAIFDSALSATVTYVSPNTKYQPLVFSYNAVTYTSANALARAMIADWRVAHDTVAGWPTGLARSACNNFSFLLVRCGRELLSLRYAKEFHLLCVGGSFVGSQRAQLSPQAVARLAPLQVPFTVHLRGEPRADGGVRDGDCAAPRCATQHAARRGRGHELLAAVRVSRTGQRAASRRDGAYVPVPARAKATSRVGGRSQNQKRARR